MLIPFVPALSAIIAIMVILITALTFTYLLGKFIESLDGSFLERFSVNKISTQISKLEHTINEKTAQSQFVANYETTRDASLITNPFTDFKENLEKDIPFINEHLEPASVDAPSPTTQPTATTPSVVPFSLFPEAQTPAQQTPDNNCSKAHGVV